MSHYHRFHPAYVLALALLTIVVSSWYTRTEITMVTALFLSMNQLGGGVWSLMLYALARHSVNSGGLAGRRLMNYFLGGVTTFFGLMALLFLNTPDKVWWLSKEEKRIAKARTLKETSGGADTHSWEWKQVWECLRDPVFYLILVFNIASNVANGVVTTFGTLVTQSFGFSESADSFANRSRARVYPLPAAREWDRFRMDADPCVPFGQIPPPTIPLGCRRDAERNDCLSIHRARP